MNEIGHTLSRKNIGDLIQNIFEKTGQQSPFKEGKPSSFWVYDFLKRKNLNAYVLKNPVREKISFSEDLQKMFDELASSFQSFHWPS